jgi:hypothetical protein
VLAGIRGLGVRRAKIVTDVPLFAALLRQVPLGRISKGTRQEVVLAEVHDSVLMAPQDIDVKWRLHRKRDGDQALVTIVPKEHVDRQVAWMKAGRFAPRAAYSKAQALALAAQVQEAVLVWIGNRTALITLVHEGHPVVAFQVPAPRLEDEDPAAALAQAIEEVAFYHSGPLQAPSHAENEQTPQRSRTERLPIMLFSGPSQAERLSAILEESVDRRVLTVTQTDRVPEGFPQHLYTLNLGLWRAARKRPGAKGAPVPLNLLSERHLPRPFPAVQAAVFATITGLAWASPSLIEDSNRLQDHADVLGYHAEALQSLQRDQRLASLRVKSAQAKDNAANVMAAALATQANRFVGSNDNLVRSLSAVTDRQETYEVRLSSVVAQAGKLDVDGRATSFGALLDYAEALRAQDTLFREVKVLRTESAIGGAGELAGINFQMRLMAVGSTAVPSGPGPTGGAADLLSSVSSAR